MMIDNGFNLFRCQNFTEMSIGIFKCYAHVDPTVDIKAQWLDLLSEPLLLEKTNLLLEQKSNACSSISHVRNVIFASYVAHKWNMPFPQVLKWVEKGIKSLPFSISRLMQILDVLSDIGFSQEQVNFRFQNFLFKNPVQFWFIMLVHYRY
jgi:hypothetical protein